LREELREGDVVFLKGSRRVDHLERIILACEGPMTCFRDDCRERLMCRSCPNMAQVLEKETQKVDVDG
jgi:hypothetical protein